MVRFQCKILFPNNNKQQTQTTFKQHLRKLQNFWLPKMFKFNLQTRKIFLMIRLIGVFLRLGFSRVRQKLYGYHLMLKRLQ